MLLFQMTTTRSINNVDLYLLLKSVYKLSVLMYRGSKSKLYETEYEKLPLTHTQAMQRVMYERTT